MSGCLRLEQTPLRQEQRKPRCHNDVIEQVNIHKSTR